MQFDPVTFTIQSTAGAEQRSFEIGSVAGARFSSRDVDAMREKMDQMIAAGLCATRTNPSIFRIARYLLTQSDQIEVQGPRTGGECEVVAIICGDQISITIGSDQCDRELDPMYQDKPKQMCPHPVGATAWPYEEVKDHWDDL